MSELSWDVELVNALADLADEKNPNRAAMAHLCRGLDRPPDYILGRVGWLFRQVPDWALLDALLSAGLFAWMKGKIRQTKDVDFGSAFGFVRPEEKQKREKRFIDLIDTDKEELPYKLRQAITLIGKDKDGVGLDWVLLMKHLRQWDHPDRWVQKKWARGFWSAGGNTEEVNTKTETVTS